MLALYLTVPAYMMVGVGSGFFLMKFLLY